MFFCINIKRIFVLLSLLILNHSLANASTISVISSDGIFAGYTNDSPDNIVLLTTNPTIENNLTDGLMSTMFWGSTNGATSAQVTLQYQAQTNQTSDHDLAFFFLDGANPDNGLFQEKSMTACFTVNCDPTGFIFNSSDTGYNQTIEGNVYDVSVITIDLDYYNLANGQHFTIDLLGEGTYNSLAGIESLTTVPVPAAVWLFLSGFGALGIIARRKKT